MDRHYSEVFKRPETWNQTASLPYTNFMTLEKLFYLKA